MLLALGAVSSALDALQSLTTPKAKSPPVTGFSQDSSNPFDLSGSTAASGSATPTTGGAGFTQISPATMSTLLAAQSQSPAATTTPASTSPSSSLQDLFSQIDSNGDGQISKSEFENALGAGGTNLAQADDVFNKLDTNGDGSVSLGELKSALQGAGGHHGGHHHMHAGGSGDASSANGTTDGTTNSSTSTDSLLQALAASSASTTSSTSANGGSGLSSSSLTPVDSSQLTPISLSAAAYSRLEQLIQNGPQFSTSTTPLSLNV
jgi:EF-hand domain pair